MQCETKIYKKHKLVVDTIVGEVTVAELSDKFFSLFNNPDYDESMRGLCDLRKAKSRMDRSEFIELTDNVEPTTLFGEILWAIVTAEPSDGLTPSPAYRALTSSSGGYALTVPADGQYTGFIFPPKVRQCLRQLHPE
jgi:hypothetical protein